MMKETKLSPGETNLEQLLSSMEPRLATGEFVFCSVPSSSLSKVELGDIVVLVKEEEGTTLVLERTRAQNLGFEFTGSYAKITLQVHSSLDAVGLTAAFSAALGKVNISANVVAGYYHDHIFVAYADGPSAIEALKALSAKPS